MAHGNQLDLISHARNVWSRLIFMEIFMTTTKSLKLGNILNVNQKETSYVVAGMSLRT
jgi:hypothetical protein